MKKVVILTEEGQMVDILEVKTYTDLLLLHQHQLNAQSNKNTLAFKKRKTSELRRAFLKTRLDMSELKVSALFNEIQLLKGEIDEPEYEKLNKELGLALQQKQAKLIEIEEEAKQYELELE